MGVQIETPHPDQAAKVSAVMQVKFGMGGKIRGEEFRRNRIVEKDDMIEVSAQKSHGNLSRLPGGFPSLLI